MYTTTHPNSPATSGGYVPYFYEAGLYLSRSLPTGVTPKQAPAGTYGRYDFSSEQHPWEPSRQPQTVEQIVLSGYFAVPIGEVETAIISDKNHTARLGLEDTIRQVRNRYELYQRNMYELHQGVCEADNALFRQVGAQGAPADNRQQYSASKLTQELYEQMRGERVNLWKDVSRLKQFLPEAAQNYLSAYRKMAILEDDKGDAF